MAFGASFAEDVRRSLQLAPRQLSSRYLYDALGSALFDAICELPWYGITRAEIRLLATRRDEILASAGGPARIVELGPGDGRKLLTLLEGTTRAVTAHLVDVSPEALTRAARTISEAPQAEVVTHHASFEDGLNALAGRGRHDGSETRAGRTLLLFLGSNIGNFDADESRTLLERIRAALAPGDAVLLGADLVKPERDLLLAYDDPLGVSAAFNLNVLLRINRELGGDFDLRAFRHRAVWNARCARMEMSVVSTRPQRVRIASLDLQIDLDAGEAIWTERSYKYTAEGLLRLLRDAGLDPAAQWIDGPDAFALTLARRI